MSAEHTPEEHKVWLAEQPKKMIVVKTIIRSDAGNVLIAKPTHKETWQLPGGGVDMDESPEDAVAREVSEEFSLNIVKSALRLVGIIYKKEDDTLFLLYEYGQLLGEDNEFVLPGDELKEYRFVEPEELQNRLPAYYSGFLENYLAS